MVNPFDIRFLSHDSIPKAIRKYGLSSILLNTSLISSNINKLICEIILGNHSKAQETELLSALCDIEIEISKIITALNAQNDAKMMTQAKLDKLTDKVLRKD